MVWISNHTFLYMFLKQTKWRNRAKIKMKTTFFIRHWNENDFIFQIHFVLPVIIFSLDRFLSLRVIGKISEIFFLENYSWEYENLNRSVPPNILPQEHSFCFLFERDNNATIVSVFAVNTTPWESANFSYWKLFKKDFYIKTINLYILSEIYHDINKMFCLN